ncbi:hypothetical protein [Ketobacter sp.]|uniref:poly(ethylene terephthalate) hydrolase family protein n=1 Tax=Ketobacter sp. TaxID=2083498 RepID=UPI000F0E2861|nr:hypothetical protein [Ketobacter sp.]RLU01977.1 MAG: hypothetical protein D9N14_00065 [Ketobacter sp.]
MRCLRLAATLLAVLWLNGCEYPYSGDGYAIVEENPNAEPWFDVFRPLDLTAVVNESGQLLPVIVWANGGCLRSNFTWQPLFKRWAAQGYVVLAMAEEPGRGALGTSNVQDHGALIDWALTQSPYADMIDAHRVVAAGNSCGGVTALGLAAVDARVAAVFVLSGSSAIGSTSESIMQAIDVPVGYVTGGPTDIAGGPARSDFDALPADASAMLVQRVSGGHVTVSTTVAILEEVADIALNWMNLALDGDEASYLELTSETVCATCTPGDWVLIEKNMERLVE